MSSRAIAEEPTNLVAWLALLVAPGDPAIPVGSPGSHNVPCGCDRGSGGVELSVGETDPRRLVVRRFYGATAKPRAVMGVGAQGGDGPTGGLARCLPSSSASGRAAC
jgi:hypothetical protein